ncbi:MAG: RagB/SusD family nutrient uptake outer membrane protein [Sphingobacteriales bacterium]|nr:RagB/SusD family nutrient uptake outer membrane protein [Sphingobacteriales bacterium]MBI3719605.1 RagB/SusD family nutrient uptake outer membrane protein [Sphingobacteriales bacterium]
MKKFKNKILIMVVAGSGILVGTACKKFLDKQPIGTLNPSTMATEKGVQGLLIGAYSLVDGEGAAGDGFASGASNWILGGVTSDDAYKGSDPSDVADAAPMEQWTTLTPANGAIPQKWIVCYAGAQRCNDVLKTLKIATGISTTKTTQIEAQARFLRAFYHFELKKIYNKIIYADETVNPGNLDVNNSTDVWPKIESDVQFAADNLPESWGSEVGRANKWAAKSLLAKVYMYEHKLSAAYPILQDIIANGKNAGGAKYALNARFYSNFNPAQKNSAESVFAAQTSVKDNSSVDWGGDPNGNYGDILNFPYTGGPGGCCGFYNPSQDLANAYKTDANGLPLLDTYFNGLNVGAESGTAYAGNLDPRIDWTMGRPGIPYLDWGIHPGITWIRNPTNDGNKSPLKNVYAASQKDAYTDVGSAYWGPTELVANNVNIIRFSDVILWAAECAADAGDLAKAKDYVNQVRSRMKDHPEAWVKTGNYDAPSAMYTTGSNAATYNIGLYASFPDKDYAVKAIRMERRLELAMEGQRFFDLVRWGIAATTINAYIAREKSFRPLKAAANFTANKNEYMPIPQGEIDNMNSDGKVRLTQNTGY